MERMTERKIVLVTRETRLDDLIFRYNTLNQARFYIEHLGADFTDYLTEDQTYKASVSEARSVLGRLGRVQELHRNHLPGFVFGDDDIVVVLGQDGLVANTLKYLTTQPVTGVNPDPGRWDGILLPFQVPDLGLIIPEVLSGKRETTAITMAEARLQDGQRLLAVNDLFIGASSHVSARYSISVDGQREDHSSSGVIVSTGLGATGWLKSIITGAAGIVSTISGTPLDLGSSPPLDWNARALFYSVREPFPSQTTAASMVFGKITEQESMALESRMPGHGVIFSDGVESDYLQFNSGMTARIAVADQVGHLVV